MTEIRQTEAQKGMWNAFMYFGGSIKYKTGLDKNLSKTDIYTMAKSMQQASVLYGEEGEKINEKFSKLLTMLKDKDSDGGDNVTRKEQLKLYEYMLNVTGHPYEYSSVED